MKLAGGIETIATGSGTPRSVEFARDALAAKNNPGALEKLLIVQSRRGETPPAKQMEQLKTLTNLIGEGGINPATGIKDRPVGSEALTLFNTAETGRALLEDFRNYHTLTDVQKKDLQTRVSKVLLSRPMGDQIITKTVPDEQLKQADAFINKHYNDIQKVIETDVQRMIDNPDINPTASAEQVLAAKNRYNDADFTQKEATEALDQGDKHLTRLNTLDAEYKAAATHNAAGEPTNTSGLLEFLQDGEITRKGEMTVLSNRIKDNQQRIDSLTRQIKDLDSKKFFGSNRADLEKQLGVVKKELETNTLNFTDRLSDQQKLEDMRKEKQELPENIRKAKTEKNRLTSEKLKSDDALARSSEELYEAKRVRVATERALADSVDHAIDFAIDETLNQEIKQILPHMEKGMQVEMQERLAKLDERLLRRFRKEGIFKRVVWNDKEINELFNMLRDGDDTKLDAYIKSTQTLHNPKQIFDNLVDDFDHIKPEEQKQYRAVLANRILIYQKSVNNHSPSKSDLLKFQTKGWVDPMIDIGIMNNKAFVDKVKQVLPGEEVTTDNPLLKSRLKAAFLGNSDLFLTLLTMSAATLLKEEK